LKIEIANLTKNSVNKKYFQEIGEVVLRRIKQPQNVEVSLVFVGDARMKNLNRTYRNIDKTTDVLSFCYEDKKISFNPPFLKEKNLSPLFNGGSGGILGEIVISIPQAKKQARQRGYPLKRELSELFVHGILHLVGYDDEREEDYNIMIEKQEEILAYLSTK
jgi:probable rRNA maturation factor